jgi:uncharacterized protein YecE (DUF72 family)
MAGKAKHVRVGTSGWVYADWEGKLYPRGLPQGEWLGCYARRFDTVEVNNSFYRLPSEETMRRWAREAPAGFLFAVKASRYLTHQKKLKDPTGPLGVFLDRAALLGKRLGPVLFQLPPHWRCNPDRLRGFLRALPAGPPFVFEFRDPSWYTDEVRSILARAGAVFCVHDMPGSASPLWETASTVYVRLHGPGEHAYQGSYSQAQLEVWADRVTAWREARHDVFAYFNNDGSGHAVENAGQLRQLLGLGEPPPRGGRPRAARYCSGEKSAVGETLPPRAGK